MNNENPITIDLSYLYSVAGGDKDFEKELLQNTMDTIEIKVNNLEKALQAEDAKTISSNAHSLKSLSAIAGIPQIQAWSMSVNKLYSDGIFHTKDHESVVSIITNWAFAKTKLQQMMMSF